PESSTLSLHDALPISQDRVGNDLKVPALRANLSIDFTQQEVAMLLDVLGQLVDKIVRASAKRTGDQDPKQIGRHVRLALIELLRSEEHTSELQSRENL